MSLKTRFAVRSIVTRRTRMSWAHGLGATLALLFALAAAQPARSDDWPARPVTIIVPFPAGGNTDSMARMLAQKLSEKFGRNFIVENRMGASGSIGMMDALHAAPDGYTLVFGAFQQISVLPQTEKVKYNPATDFSFRGGAPAVAALIGGHVQAYFGNASELIPLAKDPHIRILATSAPKRMPQLPDVPAMNELYPGFALTAWNGLMAPAKVPQDIKDKLEAAAIAAAHDPDVMKKLGNLGITPVGSTSKEFDARIARESAVLNEAIAAARSSAQ